MYEISYFWGWDENDDEFSGITSLNSLPDAPTEEEVEAAAQDIMRSHNCSEGDSIVVVKCKKLTPEMLVEGAELVQCILNEIKNNALNKFDINDVLDATASPAKDALYAKLDEDLKNVMVKFLSKDCIMDEVWDMSDIKTYEFKG